MSCPCRTCTTRVVGCHSNCAKYYEFKRDAAVDQLMRDFATMDTKLVDAYKDGVIYKQKKRSHKLHG